MWCSGRVAGAIRYYRPCLYCAVRLVWRESIVGGLSCTKTRVTAETWVGTGQRNVRRGDYCQQDRTQLSVVPVYGGRSGRKCTKASLGPGRRGETVGTRDGRLTVRAWIAVTQVALSSANAAVRRRRGADGRADGSSRERRAEGASVCAARARSTQARVPIKE